MNPPTTTSSDTATVEVLTAEVRVLMVGSRQITLSVAKQLDRVRLDEMTPFGRVKLPGDEHLVIGRNNSDGNLVLARYQANWSLPHVFAEDLEGKVTVCAKTLAGLQHRRDEVRLRFGDQSITIDLEAVTPCDAHQRQGFDVPEGECGHWSTNGLTSQIQAVIDQQLAARIPDQAAAVLPLIVLAGLR